MAEVTSSDEAAKWRGQHRTIENVVETRAAAVAGAGHLQNKREGI